MQVVQSVVDELVASVAAEKDALNIVVSRPSPYYLPSRLTGPLPARCWKCSRLRAC